MNAARNRYVLRWAEEVSKLAKPDRIVWCDGSAEERKRLTEEAVASGVLIRLNQEKLPNCFLHRSHPSDVARVEHLTYICTPTEEEAGPTNHWMAPAEAYAKCGEIYRNSMKGRTMYVVPFLMGPPGSPFSKVGIEITDSLYVVLNMGVMTRMGRIALDHLGDSEEFVKGLHGLADLDPHRRLICHFPEDNTIWSVGSGYGGNALLGKKCFALRLAGWMARQEGWLAEHMLIMGLEAPDGGMTYVAAAFPSACGKTNFAMMVPPEGFEGYKIHTIGDDIAWLRFGGDGRLWAVNPEAGFFGVAPGTSERTNPNAMKMLSRNSIFTNVVLTPEGTVWWEGMDDPPEGGTYMDWKGNAWHPGNGTAGAHPNARFTTPIDQCPTYSPKWADPGGVPISAIIFGARRSVRIPLVVEAFDWEHGVYLGATLSSETTAAATGEVGVVRRDPMAMLPFCGYNMGDYFAHWLSMGKNGKAVPKIFRVNWFQKGNNGKFLWPGFGENIRVLKWIVERCHGKASAVDSPIGRVPPPQGIDLTGLSLRREGLGRLLTVDTEEWRQAAETQIGFFGKFGSRLPSAFVRQREALLARLG